MNIREEVAGYACPGMQRTLMEAITLLGGESKRIAAGLTAISHRHGANIDVGYRAISKYEGVYVVYSGGGTWRPRQVELQWPTTGRYALMFVTSNSDCEGKAYRYLLPKAIAAASFESALLHREEYVHIERSQYDDRFKIDDTFWDYPEYSYDPRSIDECMTSAYALFEPLVSEAEYYTQSDVPCMLTNSEVYISPFRGGKQIDTLDGYRGFFYIRHNDGKQSPPYYFDGWKETYFSFPIKGPRKGGLPINLDVGDATIIATEGRHIRAHLKKSMSVRHRIATQPHAKVHKFGAWDLPCTSEVLAAAPHGFGAYVDKWLN